MAHSLCIRCSPTYWATFVAQILSMLAFGIGSALWLSREARRHRDAVRQAEVEMAWREEQKCQSQPSQTQSQRQQQQSPLGLTAAESKAVQDTEGRPPSNEGGSGGGLLRFTLFQAFALLAGLVGERPACTAMIKTASVKRDRCNCTGWVASLL